MAVKSSTYAIDPAYSGFAEQQLSSRILVVDDLPSARRIVRTQLEKLGFVNVEEAADGKEALEMIIRKGFDIVVSDWVMPEIDGVELLRRIREELHDGSTAFLMVTAVSSREQVLEAAIRGVSDYIIKPFGSNVLADKLKDLFTRGKKQGVKSGVIVKEPQ